MNSKMESDGNIREKGDGEVGLWRMNMGLFG